MSLSTEPDNGRQTLDRKTGLIVAGFFFALLGFFLAGSGSQFLDGDDAMQAIWALAKQKGLDPFQFPLHGYQSRSGSFALIYLFSFVFKSPLLSYSIVCALFAAIALTALPRYLAFVLGIKPRPLHWLLTLCLVPEMVYAGLYPNAAIIGYGFGFLALLLSIRLLRNDGSDYHFILSGALYGFALATSFSSAYLALAFPIQHLFLKKRHSWKKAGARFICEMASGAVVYSLILMVMGLKPWSPLTEFSEVVEGYQSVGLQYTLITLAGAFNPWTPLILGAGLIIMLQKKMFLPLTVGIFSSVIYLVTLGKLLKTFQHALILYLLVGFCALLLAESWKRYYGKIIYLGLLVLPLFFGVRLYLPEQPHRGPGFTELDTGQGWGPEQREERGLGGFKVWQSPRINILGRGVRLALGSGFMLPTIDGGRAFNGHFWAWAMDWRDYLDYTNHTAELVLQSEEETIIQGQYALAAIAMYDLIQQGYRLTRINWRDYDFQKGDRRIKHYWYFDVLNKYVGKREMSLEPLPESVERGLLVTYPSFAFKLETGEMSIKGFNFQSLGYYCFRISRIK